MNHEFREVRCICGLDECPYKKSHCCLGEVDIHCIRDDVPFCERHHCKQKHSKMVLATVAA